jgi:hypothetical protein
MVQEFASKLWEAATLGKDKTEELATKAKEDCSGS